METHTRTIAEEDVPVGSGRQQLLAARERQPGMSITYGPHQGAREQERRRKRLEKAGAVLLS